MAWRFAGMLASIILSRLSRVRALNACRKAWPAEQSMLAAAAVMDWADAQRDARGCKM